ncbi:MAG: endolytic transglycosylase MltG [Armatimonadetes bacterium]|nr:endolytic transglycosylase MltG [Armatimonadota bacterium]
MLRPVAGEAPAQIVTIPRGASVQGIATLLHGAGLIRSPAAFAAAARLRGVGSRLQSGEYALSPAMSTLEILDRLASGQVLLHRLTVPEGYTAAQIAGALAARGLAEREAFLRLARAGGGRFSLPWLEGRDDLEGYLFPDTYLLPRGLPVDQIVARLLARFEERVTPDLRRGEGLSLHEAVIIASMVEREARLAAERPVIAGVITNRLRRGWPLEIDATVLYALGRTSGELTVADLQVDSPYNTYRRTGLPPGPISNPGLAAITAARHPAATPYLFYVLRPDGSHAFSRTFQEHQQAIRRWRP